tara:strand:+ start:2005 stop:5067 length:3063 start_codon:yes stop_codon:yes gene_type:complete
MANNKKITDLPLRTPIEGYNFVVATGDYNYRVEYSAIESAIKSSIGPTNPAPDPDLSNKINLLSGRLDDTIDDLAATGEHLHEHVDAVSGDLTETGIHLHEHVDIVSGDLLATGEYLEEHIEEGHGLPGGSPGISESSFMFFHDLNNNDGPTFKTYYETPTQNVFLSGVMVDSLEDVKASIRWDGPDSHYMGTGYINEQEIPLANITEIGDGTRRFEGYLDNLNLDGKTVLTGSANGVTGKISLIDLGAGPVASNITIDQIVNSTPKAGEQKGTTALKAGDQIDVFVTYNFGNYLDEKQHPNTIEVKDDGLSDHIDFASYNLVDNGNGTRTATIPVTVSDRVGDLGIKVRAVNNLGSTGDFQSSTDFPGADDSRLLDQLYPTITASDPTSYNGRSDGLREGESTTFSNSVANWDSANDTILYTASTVNNANISIASPNSFSDPKNISYVDGIFADDANVNISTLRTANGATDSKDITVKVANGPEITSLTIPNQAKTAVAPNIVGTTQIKGGDVIEVIAEIDTQGEAANSIQIRVFDEGISNGAAFSSYNSTPVGGDIHQYIIPVTVTSSAARNGPQSVKIEAKNQYDTLSDETISSNQITVNQTAPVVSITSVTYPVLNASTKNYTLTANGSSDYVFAGDATGNDPALSVNVGDTLVFQNNSGGHALAIKDSGNSNVATQSGTSLSWTPTSAGTYTYYCQAHPGNMFGTITVSAAQGFQQAIKSGESAVIQNLVSGQDSVVYESPSIGGNSQLDVANPTTNEPSKIVNYQSGGYNITTDNFKISATKTSNGAVTVAETTVNIANDALQLSITSLASSLESSPAGIDDNFNLNSNQKFLSIPTLSTDGSQSPASQLQVTSDGTNEQSNKFKITVKDLDEKGTFAWVPVAYNLANIKTETITTNPNYTLAGFSERTISADPNSLGAGLASIGTSVVNGNNVSVESLSKGGGGSNGGTDFSYQSYANGTQLDSSYDVENKFAVCDSNGIVDSNGDHIFNLDKLNRAANTSTNNPASFVIKED